MTNVFMAIPNFFIPEYEIVDSNYSLFKFLKQLSIDSSLRFFITLILMGIFSIVNLIFMLNSIEHDEQEFYQELYMKSDPHEFSPVQNKIQDKLPKEWTYEDLGWFVKARLLILPPRTFQECLVSAENKKGFNIAIKHRENTIKRA
mmetsp:Transcript_17391/g.29258  ORF Transcript_17391/g.29258 Transcript_17391/m.29258 type:complete len:146 (+) Transcript_17391:418-855(+)